MKCFAQLSDMARFVFSDSVLEETSTVYNSIFYFLENRSSKYGGGLVAKSWPTLCHPMTVAHQFPLSVGFSRQEYWTG